MNQSIKPCPFCGGEAELMVGGIAVVPEFDDAGICLGGIINTAPDYVECQVCHATGPDFCKNDGGIGSAVAAWNRRV